MADVRGRGLLRSRGRWWPGAWPWIGFVGRLVVGGVWVAAGLLKLPDPAQSVRAVRAYRLLPEAVVPAIGYGLPILEVAIGAMLILGIAIRVSAVVSAGLVVAFIIGISSAWARNLQIDCGCFGGGGQVAASETRYPQEIARDTGLLIISLALATWPRTRFALARIFGQQLQPTDLTAPGTP